MKNVLKYAPLALLAVYTAVPAVGAPPVQAYRAVGTEPFWGLTITERELIFEDPDGATRVVEPTPRPARGAGNEAYQTPRLNVNVVHAQCNDGMSDRIYPDKVEVTANGRSFKGCGGPAAAPVILAVTNWTPVAVNGQKTPNSTGYYIKFDDEELTARFGCNRLTSDYDLTFDTLTAGPVGGAKTACQEMSFESQASAILSRPMRIIYRKGDRVTLANSAGSIDLRRTF